MDNNSLRKIIEDRLTGLDGAAFQDLCDRLGLLLYPKDYTPVRAAGRGGDSKMDGYAPKARVFFAAHATRGETQAASIAKIKSDLEGCIAKHKDVQTWIFLTNDTLTGDVETAVDELRSQHSTVTIETWGHKKIADKIASFDRREVEGILDVNLGPADPARAPTLDLEWVGASGGTGDHVETMLVKNIGNATAIDARVSLQGDTYEWVSEQRKNLDPGVQMKIEFHNREDRTYSEEVNNLTIVMESEASNGQTIVSSRRMLQERVPSGLFLNFKRGDHFGRPASVTRK